MKFVVKKNFSRAALIAGIVSAAWTPSTYACSDTPVLASICIMAVPYTFGNFNGQYVLAVGQELQVRANPALYSLIGITYGGDGQTTFKLPDLRGKFVVGSGGLAAPDKLYKAGDTGGTNAITLSVAQLPPHQATLTAIPVSLTGLAVDVTLPALKGTASVDAATLTGTVADLKMNVSSTGNGAASPAGAYLGKPISASSYIYTSAAPDAALNAGAISGGTVLVKLPASTPSVTIDGGVKPTVSLSPGTPTVTGFSQTIGAGQAFDNRPPFIALTYYIAATNGLYPSRD